MPRNFKAKQWLILILVSVFSWGITPNVRAESDILITVSDPDRPGITSGHSTMQNTILSCPTVSYGQNRELGTLRIVGKEEIKNPLSVGNKVKITLPTGLCYMQTPTAENYRKYVEWPATLDGYLYNQITDDGDQAGIKFLAGTPTSITLEVQNLNPENEMVALDIIYNKDNHSKVKVSQIIESVNQYHSLANEPISRIEFFSRLAEISEPFSAQIKWLDNQEPLTAKFSDLENLTPQQLDKIKPLVDAGVINGYENGLLKPFAEITRAQAVYAISKLVPVLNQPVTFNDAIPDWAQVAINSATAHGIITGYPDKTFRPNQNLNHTETLIILQKTLELQ